LNPRAERETGAIAEAVKREKVEFGVSDTLWMKLFTIQEFPVARRTYSGDCIALQCMYDIERHPRYRTQVAQPRNNAVLYQIPPLPSPQLPIAHLLYSSLRTSSGVSGYEQATMEA
jgi:hypothetical protein